MRYPPRHCCVANSDAFIIATTMPNFRCYFQLLIISFAIFAFSPTASGLGPKGDAFVGYSRLGNDAFYPNTGGLNGWEGALHLKVKPFVGVEGDVAHYGTGANSNLIHTTTFLFGPRVTVGAAGVKVFVHGLVGGENSGHTGGVPISGGMLAYAVGGGVDVPIFPFFAWRVAGDYLSAPGLYSASGTHARVNTGLVFRF
jgi:hypothetical protein